MPSKPEENIDALLDRLDGSGSDREWEAADRLRDTLGHNVYSVCQVITSSTAAA